MNLQELSPAIGAVIVTAIFSLYGIYISRSARKAREADRKPAE